MLQHAIDAIAALAHVLEEENLLGAALQRGAEHRLQHRQVPAEHAARERAPFTRGRIERDEVRELDAACVAEEHAAQLVDLPARHLPRAEPVEQGTMQRRPSPMMIEQKVQCRRVAVAYEKLASSRWARREQRLDEANG